MRTAARCVATAAIAAVALSGCNTKGENLPVDIAKYQPPKLLLAETARLLPRPEIPTRVVGVAGDLWMPTATEYELPARAVQPVGTAEGLDFYALAWDEPPYDRLLVFQRNPDWWRGPTPYPSPPTFWVDFLEVY